VVWPYLLLGTPLRVPTLLLFPPLSVLLDLLVLFSQRKEQCPQPLLLSSYQMDRAANGFQEIRKAVHLVGKPLEPIANSDPQDVRLVEFSKRLLQPFGNDGRRIA
jgi:hypothetical protein